MKEKPTYELNELLENMKPDQLKDYIRDNVKNRANDKRGFYYFFKDALDEKGIKLKDVYIRAGVSESYGGQIIRMENHTKNRDAIIRLCLAGHFDLREINRALKLYGFKELYAKDSKDACLIVAINNRIFDLEDIDSMLAEHGLDKLSKDE